ncbi:methionyl-tRNA formyltransferase [Acidomonas methanolica]|uniref:methionyl-tRNA formyltransferase n=1 Tax=Acidomonas methanolica TaxID=437 RepID=UPI00211A4205|nr:methionyl-tRNA formyltransferase [Acidomonas methanolica]MCQ9155340.1 methionyl-tRNA formyltransferase [Acidomonas methanolica]
MKLIFMGTPNFAVPSLEALVDAGHEIAAVYTQPPRPAGRGRQVRRSPVHEAALARGFEIRTPSRLRREPAEHEAFAALGADAAIVAAYGLILPPAMLDAPRLGCLNVHASLLPRWRGASPIQSALLANDARTGVSIMQMEEGLDTGPVLAEAAVDIAPDETASTLHDRLALLGASLLVETLERPLAPTPQPENGVTYADRLTRESGRIDWTRPADEIDRQIRGLTPWPGAFTTLDGETLKIGAALPAETTGGVPGEIVDDRLTVRCGVGALRLIRLQRPGRTMMEAEAFLRGQNLPAGTRLGD